MGVFVKWMKLSEDGAAVFAKWLLWSTAIMIGMVSYMMITLGIAEELYMWDMYALTDGIIALLIIAGIFTPILALVAGLNALDNGIYWHRKKVSANYNIWVGVISAVLFITALILMFVSFAIAGSY